MWAAQQHTTMDGCEGKGSAGQQPSCNGSVGGGVAMTYTEPMMTASRMQAMISTTLVALVPEDTETSERKGMQ